MKLYGVVLIILVALSSPSFAQDTTCGIVWFPPIQLSDSAYNVSSPKIAVTGDDTIHVTWEGGGRKLPYIRSVDGGKTWEAVRELMTDSIRYPFATAWQHVLTNKNHTYIFFVGGDNGLTKTPIRMVVSSDGGAIWSAI